MDNLMPVIRPQTAVLVLFGLHGREAHLRVSSAALIEALGGLGFSEDSVRTTLTRMIKRGLLSRVRRGRQMYFELTQYAESVLERGARRIFSSVVEDDWDGVWTMVTYSLPEPSRSLRAELRQKLAWAGFGRLQPGVWVAPRHADVSAALEGLDTHDFVDTFTTVPTNQTRDVQLLAQVFDLEAVRATFQQFLDRWDDREVPDKGQDPMQQQLVLHADWLQVVRRTPSLPARLLPDNWPARRASDKFLEINQTLSDLATLPEEGWEFQLDQKGWEDYSRDTETDPPHTTLAV